MTLYAVLLTYTIYPFASDTDVQLTVILVAVAISSDIVGTDDGAIKNHKLTH